MPLSTVFKPRNKKELQEAIKALIEMSPVGDSSEGPHGPIGEWDVSLITDMSHLFGDLVVVRDADIAKTHRDSKHVWRVNPYFNADISKWDVSRVTNMNAMFQKAPSFNGDLSYWDVSSVTIMNQMFQGAKSFKQELCGDAWVHSKAS